MRLIDADELVYESIDSCDTGRYESKYGTGILAIRKTDIDDAPTIEPDRESGWWIQKKFLYKDKEQEFYYIEEFCSECGVKKEIGWGNVKFCPNCGCKMKGKENAVD